MICDAETRARLEALGPLVVHEDGPMPVAMVEEHLPQAVAILGQTAMPTDRIARAPKLRAIVNVEGNFLPNVDYAAALEARRSRCPSTRCRCGSGRSYRSSRRQASRSAPVLLHRRRGPGAGSVIPASSTANPGPLHADYSAFRCPDMCKSRRPSVRASVTSSQPATSAPCFAIPVICDVQLSCTTPSR
jgi:hypothetical protein